MRHVAGPRPDAGIDRVVREGGEVLPAPVRHSMESRFGAGFDSVRVHTDSSARRLEANAYTVGEHVVFAPGRFAPHTGAGSRLLAHELAHVVQQRAMPAQAGPVIQRQPANEVDTSGAHYPTESEQARIERLLRRDRPATVRPATPPVAAAPDAQPAAPAEPVVVRGRNLSPDERHALAARITPPLLAELRTIADRPGEPEPTVGEDTAMAVVERALGRVREHYGRYMRAVSLTRDSSIDTATRQARNLVLVEFVDMGSAGPALARTLLDDGCDDCVEALADVDEESKAAVVREILADLTANQADLLRRAALKGVGGRHDTARIRVPPRAGDTGLGTAVHELIHELVHPAFSAAFLDERNIVEGFTEYLTREIVADRTNYQDLVAPVSDVASIVSGPFLFSGRSRGAESMRLAYFQGRLDLIGWVPSSPEEATAVQRAGGSVAWNAATARTRAAQELAADRAALDPHSNVLGAGLFFRQGPGAQPVIAVSYVRALESFDPLARWQLAAEGQVVASVGRPRLLGGSLGLSIEYREPWFYARAGARLAGTGVPGLDATRVDVSPFLGAGVRFWNVVRVGAEGYALFPIRGSGVDLGVGASVGLEF